MTKPILMVVAITLAFTLAETLFGYSLVYRVGYGAFGILAAVIAGTFLWLWAKRSTPLALGMAFGWAGAASITAWWWASRLLDRPEWMRSSDFLFLFLALYLVGAIMHLDVIGRSFHLSRLTTFAPVAGAFLLSFLIAVAN